MKGAYGMVTKLQECLVQINHDMLKSSEHALEITQDGWGKFRKVEVVNTVTGTSHETLFHGASYAELIGFVNGLEQGYKLRGDNGEN